MEPVTRRPKTKAVITPEQLQQLKHQIEEYRKIWEKLNEQNPNYHNQRRKILRNIFEKKNPPYLHKKRPAKKPSAASKLHNKDDLVWKDFVNKNFPLLNDQSAVIPNQQNLLNFTQIHYNPDNILSINPSNILPPSYENATSKYKLSFPPQNISLLPSYDDYQAVPFITTKQSNFDDLLTEALCTQQETEGTNFNTNPFLLSNNQAVNISEFLILDQVNSSILNQNPLITGAFQQSNDFIGGLNQVLPSTSKAPATVVKSEDYQTDYLLPPILFQNISPATSSKSKDEQNFVGTVLNTSDNHDENDLIIIEEEQEEIAEETTEVQDRAFASKPEDFGGTLLFTPQQLPKSTATSKRSTIILPHEYMQVNEESYILPAMNFYLEQNLQAIKMEEEQEEELKAMNKSTSKNCDLMEDINSSPKPDCLQKIASSSSDEATETSSEISCNFDRRQENLPNEEGKISPTCWCGKKAIYLCLCYSAVYCSESCQKLKWSEHNTMCQRRRHQRKKDKINFLHHSFE